MANIPSFKYLTGSSFIMEADKIADAVRIELMRTDDRFSHCLAFKLFTNQDSIQYLVETFSNLIELYYVIEIQSNLEFYNIMTITIENINCVLASFLNLKKLKIFTFDPSIVSQLATYYSGNRVIKLKLV